MEIYQPDDAKITLEALRFLRTTEGAALRAAVAELPGGGAQVDVKQIVALRKTYPAEAVHAALAMGAIQGRAAGPRGKFPELSYAWGPPEALEQATHMDVGRHKAERLSALGAREVVDLCAGIGGDALAFAKKMKVTAIEMSPVRARCLAYNAEDAGRTVEVQTEDAERGTNAMAKDAWVHIDPARRSGGKRSAAFADLIPGPEVLARVFAGGRRGAIKLSPAVDFATLPAGHLELISFQGVVVQALLWMGTEQSLVARTATVLTREATWSVTAGVEWIEVSPVPVTETIGEGPQGVLYEVDGAITRAGVAKALMDAHGLRALTGDGGYLLADKGAARPQVGAGALTGFEIWGIVPLAKVTAALKGLPAGIGAVEVKARGHLPGIETDKLQKQWSKLRTGGTVLLFRQERQTLAAIGFRAGAGPVESPIQK